jgi:integrase
MPQSSAFSVPKYRHYRPKNLGVVRLSGRDFYLGQYGSPASLERYHRLLAEWLENGRQLPSTSSPDQQGDPAPLSINEMLLQYWHFAQYYYRTAEGPSKELTCMEHAIRPLKALFGLSRAHEFGPKALKVVRQSMIEADLCRHQINTRINRIRRVFKWAASEELVPPSVTEGLRTVAGLRKGRTAARESKPVKPVSSKHVEPVLRFVSPQVAAMIQLQMLTGMRACEVTIMRPCDIDRSGDVWIYSPGQHKTDYLNHKKLVPLGLKSQSLIRTFLERPDNAYLFSPKEAEAWRNEQRAISRNPGRKTKIYACELRARERRKHASIHRKSKRPKREKYDTDAYRRAVTYGIAKARRAGIEIPHWHPHQLRHTLATIIRKQHGLEGAQVMLGHRSVDVTQLYAERNLALAVQIARESG